MADLEFAGKVAFVTGAANGIGAAVARRLALAGAHVVAADMDLPRTEALAAEIGGLAVQMDVADFASVQRAVAAATTAYGRLDLAVNNAGISGASAPLAEYPLDAWRNVLSVNLDGVFFSLRAEIPAMLAGGSGAIVNLASILAEAPMKMTTAYTASKHGVLGLTRIAALEYADQGIRINAVAPGMIQTRMMEYFSEQDLQRYAAMHPIGRLGKPQDVADLVAFLLSDKASFITGGCLPVDGGFLLT